MEKVTVTQIERVDYEKLLSDLMELISPMVKPLDDLSSFRVDRKFLIDNFSWTRAMIEKYERSGRLSPANNPRDPKSRYYKLSDVLKLRRDEIEKQFKAR